MVNRREKPFNPSAKAAKDGPSESEILNVGLAFAMEWGSDWLKPIQERLSKVYPALRGEDLNRVNGICQAAMKYGHALVASMANEQGLDVDLATWKAAFLQRYPWIDEQNSSHLFSQGMYYAWKGGSVR